MKNLVERLNELLDNLLKSDSHIIIPRQTLSLLFLIIALAEILIVSLFCGVFIMVSLLLCFPLAYIVYTTGKIWARFYSIFTYIPVILIQFILNIAIVEIIRACI